MQNPACAPRGACFLLIGFSTLLAASRAGEPTRTAARPASAGVSAKRLERIDGVIRQGIKQGLLPGAVVLIVHRDRVVFRKAYGLRAKKPAEKPMRPDTLFDLASLTKPVATATSLMILLEQGQLNLKDRVAQYLPAFGKNGKQAITIEQLLLHTSGLIADNPVADYQGGRAKALERIYALRPRVKPGTRFTYSDVGYIVLGEIVEKVASADGKRVSLADFARRHIYAPLGMKETGFRPAGKLKERAAPTEQRDGRWIVGEVHDPRAHLLGGVAGHAGLFATADDLAVFGRMVLGGDRYRGRRILSPAAVRLMTTPRPVPGGLRALGWDVRTAFSSNRGELFSTDRGFGHTGFTGTSIWIDPPTQTAVIFLSNRVHPRARASINRLRGQVATLAAAALRQRTEDRGQRTEVKGRNPLSSVLCPLSSVRTGIDVLVKENFRRLRGRKVGLVTNHTGQDRHGTSTIDLLHRAKGVKLVALFSPEHGIRGAVEADVADSRDKKTGLPIYSLYGRRRKPTAETLKGIDTLVFDIQDAGCRFYTYITTLGYVLEAAKKHKLRVVVLDRPNPLGGRAVAGPVRDAGRESFVAYHALPVRHGLTVGELALLFNKERKIGADLEVVRMEGWRRGDLFDATGLVWVNPSPNLRSLTAALLYPGIGLLETTNLSVGRGTDRPFEWLGAPWIDGRHLAAALARRGLPGVRFVPCGQTPRASVYKGKACGGVQILISDWASFRPIQTGLVIAAELRRLYPKAWDTRRLNFLLGHQATWKGLRRGTAYAELKKNWQPALKRFKKKRRSYWLYPK
jgi:uncharacterized protein YbbC (DUF1343 family)/CubicO group peptidase (beta-lactamase class C family)